MSLYPRALLPTPAAVGPPTAVGPRAGVAHKTSLSGPGGKRRRVCSSGEEGGGWGWVLASEAHSHPLRKPAFQRKGHLRPRWQAQHGHHSLARLAPGPCHMGTRGISPPAWPGLPRAPTVHTHRSPDWPCTPGPAQSSRRCQTSPRLQPDAAMGPCQPPGTCMSQGQPSLAPRLLPPTCCVVCLPVLPTGSLG